MGDKKISRYIDHEKMYVSSRVFAFLLENLNKVRPTLDISRFREILHEVKDSYTDDDNKIHAFALLEFFGFCLSNDLIEEEFYFIGNNINEIHYSLISMLFREETKLELPIRNEISPIKLRFDYQEELIKLKIGIPDILLLETKELCYSILKLIHGFVDRLCQIYLNNKPNVIYEKSAIRFTYRQHFVSNFDIAEYITNEQFFFSRIKNYSTVGQDERVFKKVEFFLFKDIGFSIEEIASKMNIAVRALQRKLKEEDSSFRKIKENVRMNLSEKYLSDSSLDIQEVSELLAYSERSTFEKAFKKWYGKSPKVFRQNLV